MTTPAAFYTTRELAELLRVKERKIYDLAAAGEVPCRRVTGKLLFPRGEIEAWIEGKPAGSSGEANAPPIVAGSHDPLLDWSLREAGTGLGSFFDGSLDGLARVSDGRAIMSGTHVFEGNDVWNLGHLHERFDGRAMVAVAWAKRRQGLIVGRDSGIDSFAALRGKRIALRQPSSGSRILFDHLAADTALGGEFEIAGEVRTETEAAADVSSGRADAALGLETAARQYGLGFVPLAEENFDLVLPQRAYFLPSCQALWAFCRSERFMEKAEEFGGYDIAGTGEVRWAGT